MVWRPREARYNKVLIIITMSVCNSINKLILRLSRHMPTGREAYTHKQTNKTVNSRLHYM